MLKFHNCEFTAKGINKSSQVYGLRLDGAEDVLIENCVFDSTGYSALLNKATGNVTVKNTLFKCDNNRNPIEGGQTANQGNLTVEDCEFQGIPGNNFINFYQVANGSIHNIRNCKFFGGANNNIIRLSNKSNTQATFNVDNCSYKFTGGEVDEYTGFMICQDYTNRSGIKQQFNKFIVNINNLDRPAEGVLYYVYEDGEGIITDNNPQVYLDGDPVE